MVSMRIGNNESQGNKLMDYLIAAAAAVVMIVGPWIFALGVATVVPALGPVALGIGLLTFPALAVHLAIGRG
jgi:flagellar biosynthesis component FlhA